MLNINYGCYSLHSKKLLVQTQLLISLQAQSILGRYVGDRKNPGRGVVLRRTCGWNRPGLRFPVEPSAELRPVHSESPRMGHRIGWEEHQHTTSVCQLHSTLFVENSDKY
jgi:hypothetical protein